MRSAACCASGVVHKLVGQVLADGLWASLSWGSRAHAAQGPRPSYSPALEPPSPLFLLLLAAYMAIMRWPCATLCNHARMQHRHAAPSRTRTHQRSASKIHPNQPSACLCAPVLLGLTTPCLHRGFQGAIHRHTGAPRAVMLAGWAAVAPVT